MMTRAKAALAALLSLIVFATILGTAPAAAAPIQQAAPQVATTVLYPYIAPITCESEIACVLDYYPGTSAPNDGYWMAKRAPNGPIWVRLTAVPGMNNQSVAAISCTTEDMCVQSYYSEPFSASNYWMAKNAGNKWVRETKNPFDGS